MYLSRYDLLFCVFSGLGGIVWGNVIYILFRDALGLRWSGKKRETRLVSAQELVYIMIVFLHPSLWEGLVCLDFTKMSNVQQKKTLKLVYICVSYTIYSVN